MWAQTPQIYRIYKTGNFSAKLQTSLSTQYYIKEGRTRGMGKLKTPFSLRYPLFPETVLYVSPADVWGHKIWYSDACKHRKLRDTEWPYNHAQAEQRCSKEKEMNKTHSQSWNPYCLVGKHTAKPSYSKDAEKGEWYLCQKYWTLYRKGRHGLTYR